MSFERTILLLGHSVSTVQDGIAGANRSLALNLARFPGIKVYTTVFNLEADMPRPDINAMLDKNISIIYPADNAGETTDLYQKVNEEPLQVFPSLLSEITKPTYIVGHSPVTGEAARKLRKLLNPRAKVILFYHAIPTDLAWMNDELPYKVPTETEQVELAQEADVVYSVNEKIHWYYTAKFRNRAQKQIDHRLFLPQATPEVFNIKRSIPSASDQTAMGDEGSQREIGPAAQERVILILCSGNPGDGDWEGLDIALCAVNKVAQSHRGEEEAYPRIVVGNLNDEARVGELTELVQSVVTEQPLREAVEFHNYTNPENFYKDLAECSLCIIPSRAEPYGYQGLFALSSGIPTLLASDSALASLIKRLTNEPDQILVPVTPAVSAYRQDASVWRVAIQTLFRNYPAAQKRARQLQMAIRRDNPTKETHDNIICYILGGVHLIHRAATLSILYEKDLDKELQMVRDFNSYLSAVMQQCWRLKHHPLVQKDEDRVYEVVPGLPVPIEDLIRHVTDHIEEHDRRIVGFEEETGAFVVYCPTPDALSDLWAMCDVINDNLIATLLPEDECGVYAHFNIRKADVRTEISGPEFLKYKQELMMHCK